MREKKLFFIELFDFLKEKKPFGVAQCSPSQERVFCDPLSYKFIRSELSCDNKKVDKIIIIIRLFFTFQK